jgi:WD40 repeat protein
VRANALGKLTGNWIFVGKQVPYPHNIWAEVQIWAIPLDAGAPRLAFSYDVSVGGVPEAIFDNTPRLRRQFSPDGMRVVVSVNGSLVVIDLTTGQVRPLGVVSGFFPAWSKDGSQIAFVSYLPVEQVVPPEQAIFVVAASGGAAREIARVGYLGQSVEWSPDGSMVVVGTKEGTALVDVGSGRVMRRLSDLASHVSFANWRAATPQIAIATGCDQTSTTKLVVLNDATATERTLLDTGERCPAVVVQDPRWNPASLDELMYVAARANVGSMPHEYRAHVLNVRSGRDATLPLDAYEGTWTRQGDVVYVRRAATGFYGDSVRVWQRDGSGERVLLADTANPNFFGITSLRY